MKHLAKQLTNARKTKGITQEELSEISGITVRTIQRIESGSVVPREYTAKKLADALEITLHSKISLFRDSTISRKMTITGSVVLALLIISSIIFSRVSAYSDSELPQEGITIVKNELDSIELVRVVYSNELTFDDLAEIRKQLNEIDINLNYQSILFNEMGKLSSISFQVDCRDGFSGSASSSFQEPYKWTGFYRDFNQESEVAFCTGPCEYKN